MHPKSPIARLLPWLLLAVSAPLLGHCGGAADSSTETGNPPVVSAERLHIVLRDTGVEVVGDAGAVSAGSTVSVTNLSTGARALATARADGSVNVVVPGSLQDEYELTVSNGTGSQTLRISASTNGGAAGGGTTGSSDTSIGGTTGATEGLDLASASCDALESTLDETAAATSAAASTDCQSDSDCVSGVLQNAALVCTEFSRRCGAAAALRCTNVPSTLACTNGKCQALKCNELSGTAYTRIEGAWSSAPRSCTSAADCRLFGYSLRCEASCGVGYRGVASGAVAQLSEIAQAADATWCGEFERRDCPPPMPLPCFPGSGDQVPRAVCVAGQCDVEYP